jgi:ribose 5-phosphate isomerase B
MVHFYLGADHAGFALKEVLRGYLKKQKIAYTDLSPEKRENDDYPSIAHAVAKKMETDPTAHGILLCGTGIGMSIAANRYHYIRAVMARTKEDAEIGRTHNHANVLTLGGRVTSSRRALQILRAWLTAIPSQDERHVRRVKQLSSL